MKESERTKKELWVFVVIGLALAVAAAGLFLVFFERVEEEVELGPGPRARANPYLAAERLLTGLGIPAESVRGPVRLPPPDHALLMLTPRRTFGAERTEWLLDWVRSGGHLVVTPRPSEVGEEEADGEEEETEEAAEPDGEVEVEVEDPLLAALGLSVVRTGLVESEVLRLRTVSGGTPSEVSVAGSPRLAPGGEPHYTEGPGVLSRFQWGEGWLTVLSDASFLTNERLGEHEHARFLEALATAPGPPAGVWLVYRDDMPGLRQLLAGRAWQVLVSGALLLVAWLWSRGVRFGPVLASPPPGRRSLREHLEATAEFLWRRGQSAALLESERQAVVQALRRQHPVWVGLSRKERLRYLSELSGVPVGTLGQALEGDVREEPSELTRVVRVLEEVRRSI